MTVFEKTMKKPALIKKLSVIRSRKFLCIPKYFYKEYKTRNCIFIDPVTEFENSLGGGEKEKKLNKAVWVESAEKQSRCSAMHHGESGLL